MCGGDLSLYLPHAKFWNLACGSSGIKEQLNRESEVKELQIIFLHIDFYVVLLSFPLQWQNTQERGQLKRRESLISAPSYKGFNPWLTGPFTFRFEERQNIISARTVAAQCDLIHDEQEEKR